MHALKRNGWRWHFILGLAVLALAAASFGCRCGCEDSATPLTKDASASSTTATKPASKTAVTAAQPAASATPRSAAEVAVLEVQHTLEAMQQDPAQAAEPVRPAEFFAKELEPRLDKIGAVGLVLQRDGVVLYSPNPLWIGRNLATDPATQANPETRAVVPFIGLTIAGRLTRPFPVRGSDALSPRLYEWWTVGVHGTEWRVGALRPVPAKGESK